MSEKSTSQQWKEIINEKNGTVKIPNSEVILAFEAIEKFYLKILPLLKERRKAGLEHGASRR